MMLSFLRPQDTIQWFEDVDSDLEILCFIIAAEPAHRLTLQHLTQNYIGADVALGSKVGFILFGDYGDFYEVETQECYRYILPGMMLQPESLSTYGRGGKLSALQFDTVSDITTDASIEWMEIFGIKRSSLPALCVLVKGSPPVVINLRKNFEESTVLKIFGKLADIAERDRGIYECIENRELEIEGAFYAAKELEHKLKGILTANKKIESLEKIFIDQLDVLCGRFKACNKDRLYVAEYIANKHYSEASFEIALSKCAFSSLAGFDDNAIVKSVKKKLLKLIAAQDALQLDLEMRNEIQSLSDAVEGINKRRQDTFRLVSELRHEGVESKMVESESFWMFFDKYITRVTQITSLIEKGGSLFSFIKMHGG